MVSTRWSAASAGVVVAALTSGCTGRGIDAFPAKVGIVVPPDYFVTEVTAPLDIYNHAGADNMDVFLVGETMDPIVGYYGEVLTPDFTFDTAPDLDVLVAPSGGHSRDTDLENEAYIGYIREQAKNATYVTSHCWGAFALAAAGVLDKRSATTFPGYTEELGTAFPMIGEIVDDERWVEDGPVITSNGGLAAYEASLHVVEDIFGDELAATVADGLVFDTENRGYAESPKITSVPSSPDAVPTAGTTTNVAILVMDGLFINEAVAPYDVYAHAGYGENVNVYFVAATMDPITGYYGEIVTPHYDFATAPQADVLVIPSGDQSMDAMLTDQPLIDWVTTQAAGATWVTSNCWGAFTLASAGLLDGHTVTTFPGYFEDLRTAFPAIGEVVETDRVVVDGKLVTSNGGLAAYESALWVAGELFGPPTHEVIAGGLVFADQNLDNAVNPLIATPM